MLILECFFVDLIPDIFKASWLRSDERPGLGSSFNDVLPERNSKKTISSLMVHYDTLAINTADFLRYFSIVFVILTRHLQYYMSNMHFQLVHFRGLYHHHHHIALVARISLTLSRHSSLSFIALGRSSGQQPVSSHSCWIYVRAGRPAFARPCVGIHKSTSLMSSSLLLQQCPCMSGSSNLNSFRDRGQVPVQLVSCGVLLPGLFQDCTQHSCVIAIQFLLQPFC